MRGIGPGDVPVIIAPDISGSGSYKYKYNGKEYQDELGLNMYDYGARNYDPALGIFRTMDALSEIYSGVTPYSYTLNNPVLYIDPDGNYVDDSYIYKKKKNGDYVNPSLVKAYEIFANSKTGSEFLANFAREGQMIAGKKYKGKSGKYDKANVDLNFGDKKYKNSDAETSLQINDDHLQITIGFAKGSDVVASDLSNWIDDIAHEAFVHAEKSAEDFSDGKLDFSNIDKNLVEFVDNLIKLNSMYKPRKSNILQHYQEEIHQTANKKLFPFLKNILKMQT